MEENPVIDNVRDNNKLKKRKKLIIFCVLVIGILLLYMSSDYLSAFAERLEMNSCAKCFESLDEYELFIPDKQYFVNLFYASMPSADTSDYDGEVYEAGYVDRGEPEYKVFYDTLMEAKKKWGFSVIAFDERVLMGREGEYVLITYNDAFSENVMSSPFFELKEGTAFADDSNEIYEFAGGKKMVGDYMTFLDDKGRNIQFRIAGKMKYDFYPSGILLDNKIENILTKGSPHFYLVNPNSKYVKSLDEAKHITTLFIKFTDRKAPARKELEAYGTFYELE